MGIEFSKKIREIIQYSMEEARRLQNMHYGIEHFILAILRDGDNEALKILKALYIDVDRLRKVVENELASFPHEEFNTGHVELLPTNEAGLALKSCILEARNLEARTVGVEHLLLAVVRNQNSSVATFLLECGATYDALRNQVIRNMRAEYGDDFDELENKEERSSTGRGGKVMTESSASSTGRSDTPMLDRFGTDLTAAAEDGKLDRVIGREKEIERIAQILSRRKKNNPVLIGNPGVGKSAVVEGLALRIIHNEVPRILFGKKIISLSMTSLVAGTKYRGQFEERIRDVIEEAREHPEIILFIDEIHNIVGAGAVSDSMDAANMLKPALARGELQCIGATTLDEYRHRIEKDGALERRFQKVMVDPTTVEETIQILMKTKDRYEEHHKVKYTDEAIEACVKLTDRYVTDRFFPDKALDALDEAGARIHIKNNRISAEMEAQEALIKEAENNKNEAVKVQNYELAAEFRNKERLLQADLETMRAEWNKWQDEHPEIVDEAAIAEVVSMMTGIPVQRLASEEGIKLKNLKTNLLNKVIGQDAAVDTLVKAIQRSRVGLKDPKKPIGTFLFLGPTGVGKTYLAQQLAVEMFGSRDAIIRLDMSEYMEKFNVTRLVGAPPGYVGYDEGGQLTEAVRRKPYSIVLFDEIEKAHPDVFNLLLQVLDEGRLTDSYGRTVDFKNTVIILTSNIGTRQLKDFGAGIGFAAQYRADDKEYARSVITKALHKAFSPEFINRLDQIITFDQLDAVALEKIIDIELSKLYARIKDIGYVLDIDAEAKRFIAEKGYDVQYGARPLTRALQTYVEDVLSAYIVEEAPATGSHFMLKLNKEKQEIYVAQQKAAVE